MPGHEDAQLMLRFQRDGDGVALTEAPRDTVLSRKKYALAKLRLLLHEEQVTAGWASAQR